VTAIVDKRRPYNAVEVDSEFQAAHVSLNPSWEDPRAFAFSHTATLLGHPSDWNVFAFRNSDPTNAKLIRYLSFRLEDGAATSPAAGIEYGMNLWVARRWTDTVALGGTLGQPGEPTPRWPQRMPRSAISRRIGTNRATWDLRVPNNSSSDQVVADNEQWVENADPFMGCRGWHLAAAAGVPKTVDFMEFEARDPGTYPLVLEVNEGIILRTVQSQWVNMNLTINMEWEEVPLDELDQYPWRQA
jgi:hypothetical protein